MSNSKALIAEIGHVYRLWRTNVPEGVLFVLEAHTNDGWKITQEWDDPGHVANILVKHGVAPDHAAALKMLGASSCVAM